MATGSEQYQYINLSRTTRASIREIAERADFSDVPF